MLETQIVRTEQYDEQILIAACSICFTITGMNTNMINANGDLVLICAENCWLLVDELHDAGFNPVHILGIQKALQRKNAERNQGRWATLAHYYENVELPIGLPCMEIPFLSRLQRQFWEKSP